MLALALLVLCNFARAIQPLLAAHELAILAHWLDGCLNLHELVAIDDAASVAVRTELEGDSITDHDFHAMQTHLTSEIREDHGAVLELYSEAGIRERLGNGTDSFLFFYISQNKRPVMHREHNKA